jgi:hypothetical protein
LKITRRSLAVRTLERPAQYASATAEHAETLPINYRGEIDLAPRPHKPVPYGIIFSDLKLLVLLLLVHSGIMLMYLISHKYLSNAVIFDIDKDFTIPSLYQYALLAGSTLCLYHVHKKVSLYRPWIYLFVFFFIDDIVSIHETVGKFLGHYIIRQNIWFFTKRSLGEFAFLSVVASLFIYEIVRCYFRASRFDRNIFAVLIVIIGALAVFGDVLDVAHDYYRRMDEHIAFWIGFFEDGGEILTISVILWVCHNIYKYYCLGSTSRMQIRPHAVSPQLWNLKQF